MSNTIRISEIFGPTVQGEGMLIGKPTVFVRTGGCDYRCSWCDTLYAVLPDFKNDWQPMTPEEIFQQVRLLTNSKPLLITLSGGNPAIQPLGGLLDLGHKVQYTFGLETQGSVARPWFDRLDYLTLSPKPPSSGMETRWDRLERCIALAKTARVCFKVVVFDDDDYLYARRIAERYTNIPMYLQVGNHTPPQHAQEIDTSGLMKRLDWLVSRVAEDMWFNVTVLPQLHTLLWGNKRGV
jgi:7-carboxy-7-deazaguanine synthase